MVDGSVIKKGEFLQFKGLKALYAHGFEGGPEGRKARYLAKTLGFELQAPTLHARGWSLEKYVDVIYDALASEPKMRFVVGSSMGGLASMLAVQRLPRRPLRLLLCAPAFGIHRSWRQKLGELVFQEWRRRGVISYPHAGLNRTIELPYQFWIECRDAIPAVLVHPTAIIHGRRDDVVPIEESRRVAAAFPDLVELFEVDDDHRLGSSLALFSDALSRLQCVASHQELDDV